MATADDVALPVRRVTSRSSGGRLGGLAPVAQQSGDALGVGDDSQQAHASAAARTSLDIHRERPPEQLGPGSIAGAPAELRAARYGRSRSRAPPSEPSRPSLAAGASDRLGGEIRAIRGCCRGTNAGAVHESRTELPRLPGLDANRRALRRLAHECGVRASTQRRHRWRPSAQVHRSDFEARSRAANAEPGAIRKHSAAPRKRAWR